MLPAKFLYSAYFRPRSAGTEAPKVYCSVISWTYFKTSTICGITTIFSTIFSTTKGTYITLSCVMITGSVSLVMTLSATFKIYSVT